MARTKQYARTLTGGLAPRKRLGETTVNGQIVENPDLDEEKAAKLKEIEEGEMRAEMKYIDKKFTEQGQTYFAETVEEEIPEQVCIRPVSHP